MPDDNNELSERELEILRLVATGASNKEIGLKLNISANTVKVHLRNIFTKIDVASRTEAAMYAINSGLMSPPSARVETVSAPNENPLTQISEGDSLDFGFAHDRKVVQKIKQLALNRSFFLLSGLFLLFLAFSLFVLWPTSSPSIENQPSQSIPRWKILEPMPTARYGLAVAVYENKIYAIGGKTDKDTTAVVESYDLQSNSWSTVKNKPHAVSNIQAAVIAGKIYVPGGILASGQVTNILEIYDPLRNTWYEGESLPITISAFSLSTFEGKLYLFGGWDGNHYLNSVFEYDPERDIWTKKPSMPTSRAYTSSAVFGREVYVFGGYDGEQSLNINEVFRPDFVNSQNNPWNIKSSMPLGVYGMGSASLIEVIFVFGGVSDSDLPAYALEYQPNIDEWQVLESPISENITEFGMVSLGANLHILGGLSHGKPVNNNYSYQVLYTILLPVIK